MNIWGVLVLQMNNCLLCYTLTGIQICYRYVRSMPLITKLPLMLLKVSYYI